jgi:hypothetical protein
MKETLKETLKEVQSLFQLALFSNNLDSHLNAYSKQKHK